MFNPYNIYEITKEEKDGKLYINSGMKRKVRNKWVWLAGISLFLICFFGITLEEWASNGEMSEIFLVAILCSILVSVPLSFGLAKLLDSDMMRNSIIIDKQNRTIQIPIEKTSINFDEIKNVTVEDRTTLMVRSSVVLKLVDGEKTLPIVSMSYDGLKEIADLIRELIR